VNEGQLEYWCRLTLADALFGDAVSRRRGWDTDPGQVLLRYGPPEERRFQPTYLGGGDASYAKHSPRLRNRRHEQDTRMPTEAALLSWTCRIAGRPVLMEFRDYAMDGVWRADAATRQTMELLDEGLPVSFASDTLRPAATFHLCATSFAGGPGRTRTVLTLGVGAVDCEDLAVVIELLDAGGGLVATERWPITAGDRCSGLPGPGWAQVTREYVLAPGDHVVAGRIERGGQSPGESRIPFTVRAFPPGEVSISDLELVREGSAECPAPVVARAGRLWFPCALPTIGAARSVSAYFEIYHLAVDPRTGRQRFQVQYTLLPRAYAASRASRAADGRAGGPDDVTPGSQMDETLLTHRNCFDVLFPQEEGAGLPDGIVVKAAALPLEGLDVGAYELAVTVHDLVGRRSAVARRTLAIVTDAEIAAATLAPEAGR
jgi:hypothetical protein